MKIAFDYQIFSKQSYGGISRYYSSLATELLKLEQDVSIFAGVHRNNYLSHLPNKVVKGRKLTKYPPNDPVPPVIKIVLLSKIDIQLLSKKLLFNI